MRKLGIGTGVFLLALVCNAVVPDGAAARDFEPGFRFSISEWKTAPELVSVEEVIHYGGDVSQVTHREKPQDGNQFLLVHVSAEKTARGKAAVVLGRMGIVLGERMYFRPDDVFLGNHDMPRLPGYRMQMGKQKGFICLEIPAGVKPDAPRLFSDGGNLVLQLNGVPIKFKNGVIGDKGALFVPAPELAALLCARLARQDETVEFHFADGRSVRHAIGTTDYACGDNTIQGAETSFAHGETPYVQASAVLEAIGGTRGGAGSNVQPLEFQLPDVRIEAQKHITADILETFDAGEYGADAPLIVQDPYGLSPLSALVLFRTDGETSVAVEIEGMSGDAALVHDFETVATRHAIPILGLYPDHENKVTLLVTDAAGKTEKHDLVIATDPLPNDFSSIDVRVSLPEKMAPGLTFVDCPHLNGNYPFGMDAKGNIRWYFTDKQLNAGVMLTHLKNGNFMTGSGMFIPNSYNNLMSVYEVTPLGRIVRCYSIFGLHHDIRETDGGNLVFMTSKAGRESLNDYIEEVDRESGEVVRAWDLMEIIKLNEYTTRPPYSGGLFNWLHHNALWLNEADNEMLVSGRHQDLLLAFDRDTGEVKWWFSGSLERLGDEMEQTRLHPATEDFEYPTSQHALARLPDGKIILFDNRNTDVTDADGVLLQAKLYSRGVVYELDVPNKKVREVWQYGKGERSRDLYSSFASDIDHLGDNHYLIDFGGQYKMPDGGNYDHMATPAKIKFASIRTTTLVEVNNDEVVFDALVHGNANSNSYKAERKELYKNLQEEAIFSKTK